MGMPRWSSLPLLVACASSAAKLELMPFASGLQSPVGLTHADDTRMFAIEQRGRIRILSSNGTLKPIPFLDIEARVSSGGEEGLLGLAFHPDYPSNGHFYVNYTTAAPRRSRISRFSVTADDPDAADPSSELVLLTVDQPSSNHKAGWIGFGPDGYLYVPLGDGGESSNGQAMTTTLGKVLRIDVDSAAGGTAPDCFGAGSGGYFVPAGNPFVDGPGGTCDEIWSVGLRNPWRCSFDRQTGDLWIADVGESSREEVDLVGGPGENYGWRCYEGSNPYDTTGCGPIGSYTFPAFEYDHGDGCSVTGGYVYRGTTYPPLDGVYILTDYCSGNFWMLENVAGNWIPTKQADLQTFGNSAFGESSQGELFVVNHGGTIEKVGWDPCGLTIVPGSLAQGFLGVPYAQTITASLGTLPYTYTVTAGSLPLGLVLGSSSGNLAGTPSAVGRSFFDVTATDSSCGSIVKNYSVEIDCPITINPQHLTGGAVGMWYSQTITASGGAPPYTYSVSAGTLHTGLSLDPSSGLVSGTPTEIGTRPVEITAIDATTGCPAVHVYNLNMSCPVTTFTPSTLPSGTVGAYYSQTITAAGGTPPYTYYLAFGSLPRGLALDPDTGIVSGTPTLAGAWLFRVTANDQYGCANGGRNYTLTIGCPFVDLSPSTLPNGTVGLPYSQTITAMGGTMPYTYSVTAGALPSGLTLDPNSGAITGTPTTTGTSFLTITAADLYDCTGSRGYAIDTSCRVVVLSPPVLPNGSVGTAYSQTITASGGTAPYTFTVTVGTLPVGLMLAASTGAITGTPTAVGTDSFTITAADANNCTGTHPYSIVIDPAGCGAIAITPTSLPAGTEGLSYGQALAASGGTAPYAFSVTTGTLPPGITLSPAGVLSGAPTTAALSSFSVTATDALTCTGTQPFTIDVDPAISVVAGEGLGSNGVNGNAVRVFTRTDTATSVNFQAYGAGSWGTIVSAGDIDGAAYDEIITGPGPGAVLGPQVRAFLRDGTPMPKVSFFAYGTLKYGVNAAAGDPDGDGIDEILSGSGPGEVFGPHVRGWNNDGAVLAPVAKLNFFAYSTLRYGVNVEEGDVDGDAFTELLTGPGPGLVFSANARGWEYDGVTVSAIAKINFVPFSTTNYGVNLSGGDLDGDGTAGIVVTPGPGPGVAYVSLFLGYDYGSQLAPLPGYDVIPFVTLYGGRVNSADVDSDDAWDLLAGAGRDPVASSEVKRYGYGGVTLTQIGSFVPFAAAGYGYGVNAAAGGLGYYP